MRHIIASVLLEGEPKKQKDMGLLNFNWVRKCTLMLTPTGGINTGNGIFSRF